MSNSNCGCNFSCTLLAVIASIAVGIVTSLLSITGSITVTSAFSWVLLGVAVVYLAIVFATFYLRNNGCGACICRSLPALLTGILGTILTSIVLLAITFAAGSIVGAIFAGLALLFFSLIVTSTACLITCAAGCRLDD